MENNEQLEIINHSGLKRRIKRELEILKNSGYISTILSANIESEPDKYYSNRNIYKLSIFNNIDYKYYEFSIPLDYPFKPPKLKINLKLYSEYQKFRSFDFKDKLFKYKKIHCFCCESILCSGNWGPQFTIKHIFEEVAKFRDYCREISHRIVIDVIKRKYLIDDINIVEWLY